MRLPNRTSSLICIMNGTRTNSSVTVHSWFESRAGLWGKTNKNIQVNFLCALKQGLRDDLPRVCFLSYIPLCNYQEHPGVPQGLAAHRPPALGNRRGVRRGAQQHRRHHRRQPHTCCTCLPLLGHSHTPTTASPWRLPIEHSSGVLIKWFLPSSSRFGTTRQVRRRGRGGGGLVAEHQVVPARCAAVLTS